MCIAIITTAHPSYSLIVLSNRDEFLHRPTAPASWWDPPHEHVLGGRDLYRPVRGTWLGITKQGRFAVLTNFKEDHSADAADQRSRGGIVNSFLTIPSDSDETPEQWAGRLVAEHGVTGVGGFSLLFGWLRGDRNSDGKRRGKRGLAVLSNRTPNVEGLVWVAETEGETHGLSNSHYGDRSWGKVTEGEELVNRAVRESVERRETEEQLLARLFGVLNTDQMPPRKDGEDWDTYIRQLKHSIFVPVIGREVAHAEKKNGVVDHKEDEIFAGTYGTDMQTVILVRKDGNVTYIERTLFDSKGEKQELKNRDRRFDFQIEGW